MKTPIKPSAERMVKIFGCTPERAKFLYGENAKGFEEMADKARRTGRKVNGYTEAELRQSAADYAEAAK